MTVHILPPEGNLLMALTALPIFAAPALLRAMPIWRTRARRPVHRPGLPGTAASRRSAWLLAVPLWLAGAFSVRGEVLWSAKEVEEDARVLLESAVQDGVVQALSARGYRPGPSVDGYVACGAVQRAGDVVGFAMFYVATEESVGFVRAGGPFFRGGQDRNPRSSDLVEASCEPEGRSHAATNAFLSAADLDPR